MRSNSAALLAATMLLAAPAAASAYAQGYVDDYPGGLHIGTQSVSLHGHCGFVDAYANPAKCVVQLEAKDCSTCTYHTVPASGQHTYYPIYIPIVAATLSVDTALISCSGWFEPYTYHLVVKSYESGVLVDTTTGAYQKAPAGSC